MSSNLARYMTYVLKLDILQSGLFSALPFVAYLIVNLSVGYIGDFLINKSYMSRTNLRKLYGTICLFFFFTSWITQSVTYSLAGLIFSPGAILLASYSECNKTLAIACFVIGVGLMGTFASGIKVNCADLSPNYVSILMASTNLLSLFSALAAPSVAAWLTPNVV